MLMIQYEKLLIMTELVIFCRYRVTQKKIICGSVEQVPYFHFNILPFWIFYSSFKND